MYGNVLPATVPVVCKLVYGKLMAATFNFAKFGLPLPVAASQPTAAGYPVVANPHPREQREAEMH